MFKNGKRASGWNTNKLLSSMHKIFEESVLRRADYEKFIMAEFLDYPLQFCTQRWVENQNMAKKAQKIWEKIVETVNFW